MIEPESLGRGVEGGSDGANAKLENLRRAMAALGEPHRFRIFLLLSEQVLSVGGLVEAMGIPQPLVSHHLSILCSAGVVRAEREGRRRWYRPVEPADPATIELVRLIREGAGGSGPVPGVASVPSLDQPASEVPDLSIRVRGGEIEEFLL